jgi:predicted DNA-binding WGR domain protein
MSSCVALSLYPLLPDWISGNPEPQRPEERFLLLTFLLTRPPSDRTETLGQEGKATAQRFYRVEVAYNLFGEYSVMREWGLSGHGGRHLLVWFSNLREACLAAERWRRRATRRGFLLEGMVE